MQESFFFGAICIAIAIGSLTQAAWGWLTIGLFLVGAALIEYLSDY